jgi:hypothetical protein
MGSLVNDRSLMQPFSVGRGIENERWKMAFPDCKWNGLLEEGSIKKDVYTEKLKEYYGRSES